MTGSRRLLILLAGVAGAGAIAVPAAVGLSDNPSFSQRIPVRVPSSAHQVSFDDHGRAVEHERQVRAGTATPRPTPTSTRHTEPGDDRGGGGRGRGRGSDDGGS